MCFYFFFLLSLVLPNLYAVLLLVPQVQFTLLLLWTPWNPGYFWNRNAWVGWKCAAVINIECLLTDWAMVPGEGPMTFSYWANTGFWWASFSRNQFCNNLFHNRTLLGLSFMIECTFLIITSNNFSVTVDFNLFENTHSLGLLVCFVWFTLCFIIWRTFFFGGQIRNKFPVGSKENGQKSWRHRWG